MHELGVVFHIIKSVEGVAKENNVNHVDSVTLELGEVTTVIDTYLLDCFKWACAKSEIMNGCELLIEKVEAKTICEDCKEVYKTTKYGKICPYCGSENTHLICGNEVMIKQIGVKK